MDSFVPASLVWFCIVVMYLAGCVQSARPASFTAPPSHTLAPEDAPHRNELLDTSSRQSRCLKLFPPFDPTMVYLFGGDLPGYPAFTFDTHSVRLNSFVMPPGVLQYYLSDLTDEVGLFTFLTPSEVRTPSLASQRALVVRTWLVDHGIPAEHIVVHETGVPPVHSPARMLGSPSSVVFVLPTRICDHETFRWDGFRFRKVLYAGDREVPDTYEMRSFGPLLSDAGERVPSS